MPRLCATGPGWPVPQRGTVRFGKTGSGVKLSAEGGRKSSCPTRARNTLETDIRGAHMQMEMYRVFNMPNSKTSSRSGSRAEHIQYMWERVMALVH